MRQDVIPEEKMAYLHEYDSPVGRLTLVSEGESLTGLWFDRQKYFDRMHPAYYEEKELPVFAQADRWLALYFSGREPDFLPPLAPEGTPFRKAVWEILLTIPYGKTMSYKEIAGIMAKQRGVPKMAAQAVGGAVGHNPISLMIPCHRVVGADGSLTGFGGGLAVKEKLLRMEKADVFCI